MGTTTWPLDAAVTTYIWPDVPSMPSSGCPILIRAATATVRQEARLELRAILRAVLAAWSGLPSVGLPLCETPCGPVWRGELHGHTLDISFSYGGGEGWIGLIRGGAIGVDVMAVEAIEDAEALARCYLGSDVALAIREAEDPARAFAVAWTQREARLKCLKRPLVEWTAADATAEAGCWCQSVGLSERVVGAIAII